MKESKDTVYWVYIEFVSVCKRLIEWQNIFKSTGLDWNKRNFTKTSVIKDKKINYEMLKGQKGDKSVIIVASTII